MAHTYSRRKLMHEQQTLQLVGPGARGAIMVAISNCTSHTFFLASSELAHAATHWTVPPPRQVLQDELAVPFGIKSRVSGTASFEAEVADGAGKTRLATVFLQWNELYLGRQSRIECTASTQPGFNILTEITQHDNGTVALTITEAYPGQRLGVWIECKDKAMDAPAVAHFDGMSDEEIADFHVQRQAAEELAAAPMDQASIDQRKDAAAAQARQSKEFKEFEHERGKSMLEMMKQEGFVMEVGESGVLAEGLHLEEKLAVNLTDQLDDQPELLSNIEAADLSGW